MKVLSIIKNRFVPAGRSPRTILSGPFNGFRMELDLRYETQIYVGLFEREMYGSLTRLSEGIRSAIDIGAAHGEYTLYALLRTNAERVISFEPDPEMVGQLRRNLQLNGLDQNSNSKWELHTKYLAETEGPDSMDAGFLADWVVPPCLIKMDIDGGELDVLHAAAKRFLSTPGLRWLIETHSEALEKECIALLASFGYSTTIVSNAWWRSMVPEQRVRQHNRWLVATR